MSRMIIEFILFAVSTGVFFNDQFRKNLLAVVVAGLIAMASTVYLFVSILDFAKAPTVTSSGSANSRNDIATTTSPPVPISNQSQMEEARRREEQARRDGDMKAARRREEQARRDAAAEEVRRRLAEDVAAKKCPQSARMADLSGVRIRLEYNSNPHDLLAGRAVRRMLTNLNASPVTRGESADLTVAVEARVAISETIGNRHADANVILNWRVTDSNVPCFDKALRGTGSGVGPTFDAATERAIDVAISEIERQLSRSFSANRP